MMVAPMSKRANKAKSRNLPTLKSKKELQISGKTKRVSAMISKDEGTNDDSDPLDIKEILELGGTKEDYEMLMKGSSAAASVDENELVLDLQKFMKNDLRLDPSKSEIDVVDEEANSTDLEAPDAASLMNEETPLTKEGDKSTQCKQKTARLEKRLAKLAQMDISRAQCILSDEKWFEQASTETFTSDWTVNDVDEYYQRFYQLASSFYEKEVALYEKVREKNQSNSTKEFVSTVLKSGTVSDKISALALLIQESPLHTFKFMSINLFQNMAAANSTGSKRNVSFAVEALKDLLINTLLPDDRKLRYFRDQPFLHASITPKQLCIWYYEDCLKKFYFEFLRLLEDLLKDTLFHIKSKSLITVWELLNAKPEQEQNLLAILINKLGDQEKKLAAKSVYLLHLLLQHHPNMKLIVAKEIQQFLIRQNVSLRSQYYAITCLNQLVFKNTGEDVGVANMLIDIYFGAFEVLIQEDVKKKQPGGRKKTLPVKSTWDGLNAKMLAALLTGVNRALPYAKLDENTLSKHVDMLFKMSHVGTFNTSIQSLALLQQISSTHSSLCNRYYRALYDTLLDRRLYTSNKQSFYLNLLYKSMNQDPSLKRCCAFLKRLLQTCVFVGVPFVCASLYLVGQIASQRPGVWGLVNMAEDEDDGVERFVDADKIDEEPAFDQKGIKQNHGVDEKYDGLKREPLYSNADRTCVWELIPLIHHFHPTVTHYASFLIAQQAIPTPDTVNYDPLQNHTLSRFLDRFVNKNPKKVSSLCSKGGSIMQPKISKNDDMLVAGGIKKPNFIVQGENSKKLMTDDVPVSEFNWNKKEADIPVDERFFYHFFKGNTKKEMSVKEKAEKEELEEEQVWDAIKRSSGFPVELQEGLEESDSEDQFDESEEADEWPAEEAADDMDASKDEDNIDRGVAEDDEADDDMNIWANSDMSEEDVSFGEEAFGDEASSDGVDGDSSKSTRPSKREKLIDRLASRAKSLGFKGNYFDKLQKKSRKPDQDDLDDDMEDNVFASVDDFTPLLEYDDNAGLDEDRRANMKKRKRSMKKNLSKKKSKTIDP